MIKKVSQYIGLLVVSVLLAACGDAVSSDQDSKSSMNGYENQSIKIDGLAEHYHTGDPVELSAVPEEETETNQWRWYLRESQESDWKMVSGQRTQDFIGEAATTGLEIKAALMDDNEEPYAESEPVKIMIDDHHGHDEASKQIYAGYFEDAQVESRELSDFEGDWQSVFPYLQAGDLDEVFEHKAAESDSMTAVEYKEYYTIGYETIVDQVAIEGDQVTFSEAEKEYSGTYENDGYEILDYEKGNRGVRFIFKLVDGSDEMPAYIQFSDHNIFPEESSHYHLFWGDDRDVVLEEMDNWPTYYPAVLDASGLVQDMLAH
ncbi:metal-binding protein ZinT [Carnobacterium sp. ISL-102]|uniref:ZinT family metal-binding protein n=1 Tax=Carnobacterium sp. ISL-102 TaxID=2819142 RepID=UPI001BED2A36|nr:metal-binding protein ZinT [Carnobacterium sp. ISL-102]MBT2732713.1 metal-binding protein ZinT [Carnobacterium sp. ISL-102]